MPDILRLIGIKKTWCLNLGIIIRVYKLDKSYLKRILDKPPPPIFFLNKRFRDKRKLIERLLWLPERRKISRDFVQCSYDR